MQLSLNTAMFLGRNILDIAHSVYFPGVSYLIKCMRVYVELLSVLLFMHVLRFAIPNDTIPFFSLTHIPFNSSTQFPCWQGLLAHSFVSVNRERKFNIHILS